MIENLLAMPQKVKNEPDIGINKSDIYQSDPVMRFIRDKMKLTPKKVFLVALGLGVADLMVANGYDLLISRDMIIGALRDPPYLLTMFVIIPLFLYTYAWMPDGLWCLFQSLPKNGLIKQEDLSTYRDNVRILVARFNHTWFKTILFIALVVEILVLTGNWN